MILIYIILSCLVIFIIFSALIRLKFPFWSIQPVFHIYDLKHWLLPNRIIKHSLPEINKYVKILDIETNNVKKISNEIVVKSATFLKDNFLRHDIVDYIPKESDIFNYLHTILENSYISLYYNPRKHNSDRVILGMITARPMYITFHGNTIPIYYIDNLCVHETKRKQGIAPYLIQTHYYNIRHLNNNINTCLFKREGNMTPIVPLTTYDTYGYSSRDVPKQLRYPSNFKLIRITLQTIQLFKEFFKSQAHKFNCIIQPELELIIHLIKNENLVIYGLLNNHLLYSLYVFRQIPSFIKENKTSTRCFECIASIDNTPYNDIFLAGFCSAIRRYTRKYNTELLFLENTSHNHIINNFFINNNITHFYSSPQAFFLYNYASYSIDNNKCLFIY